MNRRRALPVLLLATLSGLAVATPDRTGALPVPANRIVGNWQFAVAVGPCGGPPAVQFTGFNTFHAGGTLTDTNVNPPTSRGVGMGVWEYRGDNLYRSRFRFARYNPATGQFLGMQDVRSDLVLSDDGNRIETEVDARTFDAAGNQVAQSCGTSVGTRVPLL